MGLHEPPRYINMKKNPYNETWMDGALDTKDAENFDQVIISWPIFGIVPYTDTLSQPLWVDRGV